MFSVIIPLYNKAHTIVHTLNTVINQTYKDFEVIIVNDGSTDNGVEIINKNFSDNRIIIINQENAGVSEARNRGVNESSKPYIAFLDADDEWMPLYLETIYKSLKKYKNADIVGCASYHKNLMKKSISSNSLIDKFYNKVEPINYFMNPDKMTHIGATVIRKETFLAAGGFDKSISINEDVLLLGKIAMNGLYIYVGDVLHVYVGGVEGQATSLSGKEFKRTKDFIIVINQLYKLYIDTNKKNKLVPISLKYRLRHFLLNMLKNNRYDLIQIVINNLSPDLKNKFFSINFINKRYLRKYFILYIYVTKAFWRLHRFPIVGKKSKYNDLFVEKYKNIYKL